VSALLPHGNTLNLHLSAVLPRRQPLVLGLPEVELGAVTVVNPWLAALAILEPAVGGTDSQVHDEVELLVEGGGVALGVLPGVVKTGAVGIGLGEVSVLEEGLVEVRIHDLE